MIQRSDGQTKMRGSDTTLTFCRHNVLIGYEDDLSRQAERQQVGVLSRASLTIPQRWPVIDGRLTSQIPVRAGI